MTPILKVAAIVAVMAAFWNATLSAGLLMLPQALLVTTLLSLKTKKLGPVAGLSPLANEMLSKFGHYYAKPYAGASYSATCSLVMLCCIVAGVVLAFKQAWWPTAIAAVGFVVMGFTARAFNPSSFLADDLEKEAHREILEYIRHSARG